jgi:hypothetical protein
MKAFLLWLICSTVLSAADIPTLHFEDRITWKQIFDFGFRPKHLEGLERNTCVCQNQSFWLKFKNRESKFKVEVGRVRFSFFYDDFLSMLWHQGTEAITLEEGSRRAAEFRKVFDGYVVQEITMPRLIDPSGLVDAGNDENNVKVRVGEYRITYGFDNSMRKDKPLIHHFYITWSFPGMPDSRLKDSRDVVRPPKGYEWYSLDPKVITPEPGSKAEALPLPEQEVPGQKRPDPPNSGVETKPPEKPKGLTSESRLGWWVIGILGSIIAAVLTWRWKSKSTFQ